MNIHEVCRMFLYILHICEMVRYLARIRGILGSYDLERPYIPLLPAGKVSYAHGTYANMHLSFLLSIEATAPLRADIFLYISGIEFLIDLAEFFFAVDIVLVHLCKS